MEDEALVWRELDSAQRRRLTFRYTTAPFRDLFELRLFDIYGKRTDFGERVAAYGARNRNV